MEDSTPTLPAPPPKFDLEDVLIESKQGDLYRFPCVPLNDVLRAARGRTDSTSSLALVNAVGASLVLPWRVIKKISIKGEDIWTVAGGYQGCS